jgi:hypothetical protein
MRPSVLRHGTLPAKKLGQVLQGEATRVDRNYAGFGQVLGQVLGGNQWNSAKGQRGIANAAGSGASMRCEYLFTSANQGTGACVISDGARYQVHFGSELLSSPSLELQIIHSPA